MALRWLTGDGNVPAKNETYLIGEGFRDFDIRPALDLQIVPSQNSDPVNMNFSWEIVSFDKNAVQSDGVHVS